MSVEASTIIFNRVINPCPIVRGSEYYIIIFYLDPGVYLFPCKLLTNYRVLNVYFSLT